MGLVSDLVEGYPARRGNPAGRGHEVPFTIEILHLPTFDPTNLLNPKPEGDRFGRFGLVIGHEARIIESSLVPLAKNELLDSCIPRDRRGHGGKDEVTLLARQQLHVPDFQPERDPPGTRACIGGTLEDPEVRNPPASDG